VNDKQRMARDELLNDERRVDKLSDCWLREEEKESRQQLRIHKDFRRSVNRLLLFNSWHLTFFLPAIFRAKKFFTKIWHGVAL